MEFNQIQISNSSDTMSRVGESKHGCFTTERGEMHEQGVVVDRYPRDSPNEIFPLDGALDVADYKDGVLARLKSGTDPI